MIERRDPVPPGRYSVFINPGEDARWRAWTVEHAASVKPLASLPFTRLASSSAPFSTTWTGEIVENYAGSLVLFELTAATPWVGLGLPTIETRAVSQWVADERKSLVCYWVWTESGPEVVCDSKGPGRVAMPFVGLAPWVLAGFLGWAFLNRRNRP